MQTTILAIGASLMLASLASGVRAEEGPADFGLNAIGIGVSSRTDLAIGMLEARVTLSPRLVLTAAPTVLTIENADSEYQLRVGAILSAPLGPLYFDDRNLWVFSDAGTTRYRNRFRLTAPVQMAGHSLRLQLLDEVSYEQGGRGWFRNMYGVGLGVDVARSVSVDAYLTRQDDRHRAPASMFFVVLVARLL